MIDHKNQMRFKSASYLLETQYKLQFLSFFCRYETQPRFHSSTNSRVLSLTFKLWKKVVQSHKSNHGAQK